MSAGLDSWRHEKESAWLYHEVAACEPDAVRRDLFLKLGAAAEHQASLWATANPRDTPREFRPSPRARIVAALVRRLGPRRMRPVLSAMKLRGMSTYAGTAVIPGHAMPTSLAQLGQRHHSVSGGNNLRAAVFGVSDGLVSNTALLMGVAGAGAGTDTVTMTGAAGLIAGALSMAAGEYVSVRSQREMYEYQIALEREEVAEYPDEEAEELALIYAARGVPLAEARAFSQALFTRPDDALAVLAREELGLNPDDLASPWGAALSSFVAFALGAAVPIVPFLAGAGGQSGIAMAMAATAVSLAVVGLALSLLTGHSAVRGALRLVLIGGGAGALAFGIGRLLGTLLP